jgi:hypothetical protein
MPALRRHAHRLFPGQAAFPELALTVLVPTRDRLPCFSTIHSRAGVVCAALFTTSTMAVTE